MMDLQTVLQRLLGKLKGKTIGLKAFIENPTKIRKRGGEFVLGIGLEKLNLDDYEFVVRMDGDLKFEFTISKF